jgi:hypothetical protein
MPAERPAVQAAQQRPMQLSAIPAIAELIGRYRDRREGRRRFGLEEAEALG